MPAKVTAATATVPASTTEVKPDPQQKTNKSLAPLAVPAEEGLGAAAAAGSQGEAAASSETPAKSSKKNWFSFRRTGSPNKVARTPSDAATASDGASAPAPPAEEPHPSDGAAVIAVSTPAGPEEPDGQQTPKQSQPAQHMASSPAVSSPPSATSPAPVVVASAASAATSSANGVSDKASDKQRQVQSSTALTCNAFVASSMASAVHARSLPCLHLLVSLTTLHREGAECEASRDTQGVAAHESSLAAAKARGRVGSKANSGFVEIKTNFPVPEAAPDDGDGKEKADIPPTPEYIRPNFNPVAEVNPDSVLATPSGHPACHAAEHVDTAIQWAGVVSSARFAFLEEVV